MGILENVHGQGVETILDALNVVSVFSLDKSRMGRTNMSDLISRESVIKELNELWRYVNFDSDKDVFDIIMKAPAVSGEAVLYAFDGYDVALQIHNGATLCTAKPTDFHKLPLYTIPQQPQSVADALEEAAKIAEKQSPEMPCQIAADKIRALIKRNAPKEGE